MCLVKMYKCISLWLIVLTIIMTFCVSHQKLLNDDDNDTRTDANENIDKAVVADNDVEDGVMRNHHHNDSAVRGTQSTDLGE